MRMPTDHCPLVVSLAECERQVAAERARCLEIAESQIIAGNSIAWNDACREIAAQIRARGCP